MAQERQEEVSNWLCVQVTLIQLQALQRHPGKKTKKEHKQEAYEERKKEKENVSHLRKITTAVL